MRRAARAFWGWICGWSDGGGRTLLVRLGSGTETMVRKNASALTVAILLLACGSLSFPDVPPAIEGDVIGVGPEIPFGGENRFWVKETPDAACGVVFTVTESTKIGERRPDGSIAERSPNDIEVERTVRVWAGAIAESCPGQGQAEAVELIPRLEE